MNKLLDQLCFFLVDIARWIDNHSRQAYSFAPSWREWVPMPDYPGGWMQIQHYGWRAGRYV